MFGSDNMAKEINEEVLEDLLHNRSFIEMWLDKHNHKMELIRTVNGMIAATMSSLVALKVFGVIL